MSSSATSDVLQAGSADAPMLRVLHLASGDLWAGAEVQIYHMVRALSQQRGCVVQVVLLNDGRLARELRRTGIEVAVFDEQELGFVELLRRLVKLIRRSRVNIVHSHRYKENLLAGMAATWLRVPRMVATVHGLPEPTPWASSWRIRRARLTDWLSLRYMASQVIAVSAEIAGWMEDQAPGRVSLVGNSVCLDGFRGDDPGQVLRSLGVPPGNKVVGAVGRLVPVKGMDLLIECAAEILKIRRNVSFIVVGDGPDRGKLEQEIARKRIADHVVLAGFRPDVLEIVNAFDLLVIPSRHEGIPTVLLEALALGKPVVAAAVGGIPEVVKNDVTGRLVAPGDSMGWVPAVLGLLDNPGEASRLGRRGRQDVESRWNVRKQAERLFEIYQRLVGHESVTERVLSTRSRPGPGEHAAGGSRND